MEWSTDFDWCPIEQVVMIAFKDEAGDGFVWPFAKKERGTGAWMVTFETNPPKWEPLDDEKRVTHWSDYPQHPDVVAEAQELLERKFKELVAQPPQSEG